MTPHYSYGSEDLTFPKLAVPNIQGIRALILDGEVKTSSLKSHPNQYIQSCLGVKELEGCDGELAIGTGADKHVTGIMTIEEQPDFTFYVLDFVDLESPYQDRAARVAQSLKITNYPKVEVVTPEFIHDKEYFDKYCQGLQEQHFNGAMLYDPLGVYKQGRSTPNEGYMTRILFAGDTNTNQESNEE